MSQLSTAFNAPDGTFEIGELQPGTYGLQARDASGNEAFTPNVAAGTRGLRIELKRAGVIEGRLIGFASLPNVQALRLAPGQFFPPMRATVDGDRYRIEGVPPATWEVRTASAGAAATAVVPVEAGQTVHADLQNRGSATIAGRVVDFVSGAGLPGIRCVVGCARARWLMVMSATFVTPIVSARSPAGQYGHRAERSCAPRAMPRDGGAGFALPCGALGVA